jgi:hypothetical protein
LSNVNVDACLLERIRFDCRIVLVDRIGPVKFGLNARTFSFCIGTTMLESGADESWILSEWQLVRSLPVRDTSGRIRAILRVRPDSLRDWRVANVLGQTIPAPKNPIEAEVGKDRQQHRDNQEATLGFSHQLVVRIWRERVGHQFFDGIEPQ